MCLETTPSKSPTQPAPAAERLPQVGDKYKVLARRGTAYDSTPPGTIVKLVSFDRHDHSMPFLARPEAGGGQDLWYFHDQLEAVAETAAPVLIEPAVPPADEQSAPVAPTTYKNGDRFPNWQALKPLTDADAITNGELLVYVKATNADESYLGVVVEMSGEQGSYNKGPMYDNGKPLGGARSKNSWARLPATQVQPTSTTEPTAGEVWSIKDGGKVFVRTNSPAHNYMQITRFDLLDDMDGIRKGNERWPLVCIWSEDATRIGLKSDQWKPAVVPKIKAGDLVRNLRGTTATDIFVGWRNEEGIAVRFADGHVGGQGITNTAGFSPDGGTTWHPLKNRTENGESFLVAIGRKYKTRGGRTVVCSHKGSLEDFLDGRICHTVYLDDGVFNRVWLTGEAHDDKSACPDDLVEQLEAAASAA